MYFMFNSSNIGEVRDQYYHRFRRVMLQVDNKVVILNVILLG